MKITGLTIKNFKRYTDLEISDIPETTKLVVIVGPNGSGKSSIFDALQHWYTGRCGLGIYTDETYYRKSKSEQFDWHSTVIVNTANNFSPRKGCIYVRSAYRNDPDFTVNSLNRPQPPSEQVRVRRTIDNDQAVSENYQRLVFNSIGELYSPANDDKSVLELRQELIGKVQSSLQAVFDDLQLESIKDPLGDGSFFFTKGTAHNFHFKNLSGGEKAAFDLLLDFHLKSKQLRDAVYCIDEVETHLHTKVQSKIITEMVKCLPSGGQLWVTTHSLGVLLAAQKQSLADPGSVAVLDFHGIEPDKPQFIKPSNLGRVTWEKLLSIAVDDLTPQLAPKYVIVCEGSVSGGRRKNFDSEIYNRVFQQTESDVLFISGGASSELQNSQISIKGTLNQIIPQAKVYSLHDRDEKSDEEVKRIESQSGAVLARRNLEGYILDDEVIIKLAKSVNKGDLESSALAAKQAGVQASISRGNPPDDLKRAAGDIFVQLKDALGLMRAGGNSDAFMRDILAPLISPDMEVYKALRREVIEKIKVD